MRSLVTCTLLALGPVAAAQSVTTPAAVAQPPDAPGASAWVSVFGLRNASGGAGVRAEVDLIARPAWTAGLAFGYETTGVGTWTPTATDPAWSETSARLYAAYELRRGPWEIRPSLGAGIVRRAARDEAMTLGPTARLAPIGEAAFTLSRDLIGSIGGGRAHLALSIGVLVTGYEREAPAVVARTTTPGSAEPSGDIAIALLTGLRWRM